MYFNRLKRILTVTGLWLYYLFAMVFFGWVAVWWESRRYFPDDRRFSIRQFITLYRRRS